MQINVWINLGCAIIPIPAWRRNLRKKLRNRFNTIERFDAELTGRKIIVWFDHSLGGGTEVYSRKQFAVLNNRYDVLRVQYMPSHGEYHITYTGKKHIKYTTKNLNRFIQMCVTKNIAQIVVNNLVAYKSALDILQIISQMKSQAKPTPFVSVRGHDFHCICPSFNLIDCDGNYCCQRYKSGCEECWACKRLAQQTKVHNALKSGATTIASWRDAWGKFLANTADEIILFSDAIRPIFLAAYPDIKNKIKIIPHDVTNYRSVNIKPHTEINIAVLGNLCLQKGEKVIQEMATMLPDGVNIIVVGKARNLPQNIKATGPYKQSALPRIMERNKIDVVFIASVWPETFSYTTSEAQSMNLPIVCYDMGAPAERVKQYKNGLVLCQINPQENLKQIIDFVRQLREQK